MSSATRFVMSGSSAGRFSGKPLSGGGAVAPALANLSPGFKQAAPDFVIYGKDATTDLWTATIGPSPAIYEAGGAEPTVGVSLDGFSDTDKMVSFPGSGSQEYYRIEAVDAAGTFTIGDGSFYIEALIVTPAVVATANSRWVRIHGSSGDFTLRCASSRLYGYLTDGTEALSPLGSPFSASTMYLVSFAYSVTTQTGRLYQNGLPVGTTENTSMGTITTDSYVTIGTRDGGSKDFDGSIAYVGFWRPTLSTHDVDTEVAARYASIDWT